jgi:MFS transporter, DHA1 family, multidrug resistance protein
MSTPPSPTSPGPISPTPSSVALPASSAGAPSAAPISGRVYAKLAIILGILSAFGPLSIDMYLPGLPAIAQEFQTQTAAVQQTLAVFFVGLAVGQAVYGPLADRLGRRRPLLFGCGLYAIACVGCAYAVSVESLILLRLLQALGACSGIVISRSVVRDLFDEHESARMYSFLMLVMGLAPITAPLIGGQILLYFGWRAIFWVLAGYGVLCFVMVYFGLAETLHPAQRTRSNFGQVLGIYGSLLIDRRFMGYALAGGLASSSMFAYISGSPFVFIELNGVAPEQYGLLFGANAFGLIMAAQLNRRLLTRFTSGTILRTALGITALNGLILVAVTVTELGGFTGMLIALFFCIAGTGLVMPNATAAAMSPYAARAGSAAALLGTAQFALGASAGSLVGLLHNGTAFPMVGVVALCSSSAFLMLLFFAPRPRI